MKKFLLFVFLMGFFFFYVCVIRKFELSDGYYIKANLIADQCSLYTSKRKFVLTHIGEWMETEQYIYGYGNGKRYKCYIFDKFTGDVKLFYSYDDFNEETRRLNLEYNMSDPKDINYYLYDFENKMKRYNMENKIK